MKIFCLQNYDYYDSLLSFYFCDKTDIRRSAKKNKRFIRHVIYLRNFLFPFPSLPQSSQVEVLSLH